MADRTPEIDDTLFWELAEPLIASRPNYTRVVYPQPVEKAVY